MDQKEKKSKNTITEHETKVVKPKPIHFDPNKTINDHRVENGLQPFDSELANVLLNPIESE